MDKHIQELTIRLGQLALQLEALEDERKAIKAALAFAQHMKKTEEADA